MKFKNILTESVINSLDLPKLDIAILKTFHNISDDKGYYETSKGTKEYDLSDAEKIIKVAELINTDDYGRLHNLYVFYNDYKDILFEGIDTSKISSTINFNEVDDDFLGAILYKFYYENYRNKDFSVGGFTWTNDPYMSVREALLEESYGGTIFNQEPPAVVLYFNLFPNERNPNGVGFDLIAQDEGLSEWYAKHYLNKGDYEEILNTGYVRIKPPKDLKNETLKNYFEDLMNRLSVRLHEVSFILKEYEDWVSINQPPSTGV